MKRLFLILMLALGLMLAGCDAPDSQGARQGDRAPNDRGSERAAKAERQGSGVSDKKQTELSEQDDPPSQANTEYSSGPSPDEVLASQYEHINAGRYQAAYNLFDEESQQAISEEEYRAYFASVPPTR